MNASETGDDVYSPDEETTDGFKGSQSKKRRRGYSMCGIVGYVGDQETVPILIGGLAKLEYRGYDSAGIAVLQGEKIEIRRTVGKLANLQKSLKENELNGHHGNRPHAMGDAWEALGAKRPSAPLERLRACAQRHH